MRTQPAAPRRRPREGTSREEAARALILALVDAVEVLNGRASAEDCERARQLAAALGKPGVGGSDAHRSEEMFRAATRFAGGTETVADLVRGIALGRCEAVELERRETIEGGTRDV